MNQTYSTYAMTGQHIIISTSTTLGCKRKHTCQLLEILLCTLEILHESNALEVKSKHSVLAVITQLYHQLIYNTWHSSDTVVSTPTFNTTLKFWRIMISCSKILQFIST